jgi:hypothetical protein
VKQAWRRIPLLVRVGVLGVAGLGVLTAAGQAFADPSFGLRGLGNVLRPAAYQATSPGQGVSLLAPVEAFSASALGLPANAGVELGIFAPIPFFRGAILNAAPSHAATGLDIFRGNKWNLHKAGLAWAEAGGQFKFSFPVITRGGAADSIFLGVPGAPRWIADALNWGLAIDLTVAGGANLGRSEPGNPHSNGGATILDDFRRLAEMGR